MNLRRKIGTSNKIKYKHKKLAKLMQNKIANANLIFLNILPI